jgi:uncharacterized membrane protein YqjE
MTDQTPPPRDPAGASGAYSAATNGHRGTPDAIADAINDVTAQVQALVQQEIELAKAELRVKANRLIRGVIAGTIAGIFALGALTLILHGLSWFAWWAIPFPGDTQYFWGFFTIAAILLLIGAILAFVAQRAIKRATPPAPTMAIDEAKLIKETVQSPNPETTVPPARTEVRP